MTVFDVSNIRIGSFIHVSRRSLDGDLTSGLVISCNSIFLLLKDYTDLTFSGYTFIHTSDIDEISFPKSIDIINKISREEGWINISEECSYLKEVTDWPSLSETLKIKGIDAQFEVGGDEIHLGRVMSFNDKGVGISAINRDFTRNNSPYFLRFDELDGVRLESPYLAIYSKYSID